MNYKVKKSIEYISKNQKATSADIPLKLLCFWKLDQEDKDIDMEIEDSDEWTIFLYALILYKKKQGLAGFEIEVDEIIEYFEAWQVIVQTALLSKLTDVKVKPFKFFDFDNVLSMNFEFTMPG